MHTPTLLLLCLSALVQSSPTPHGGLHIPVGAANPIHKRAESSGPNFNPFEGIIDMPKMVKRESTTIPGRQVLAFPEGTILTTRQLEHVTLRRHDDGDMIFGVGEDGVKYTKRDVIADPSLTKRIGGSQCWYRPCAPDCQSEQIMWIQQDFSSYFAPIQKTSSIVCGPGGITSSYTLSESYGVTVTAGVDLELKGFFKGMSFSVSFTYTWGKASSRAYNVQCVGNTSCTGTFSAKTGIVKGVAHKAMVALAADGQSKMVCKITSPDSHYEVTVPITTDGCSAAECGHDGAYGICYNPKNYGCLAAVDNPLNPLCPQAFLT